MRIVTNSDLIYFDNNATTQPLPDVVEAMLPYLAQQYANPSSVHPFGQSTRHAVEVARARVAALIHAQPKEIVFTSGGTESINLAIRGTVAMNPSRRRIVTTQVEHSAVLRVAEQLAEEGYAVEYVGVDSEGRIDEAEWGVKLTDDTAMASIVHANNETGVLWDVAKLAAVAHDRGIPVHVDAVQSAGKISIDVNAWPVQLVSLAAHKFHGPKGVGALYVRRRAHLKAMILGGTQERELRGGTENVAGIVGAGVAAENAANDEPIVSQHVRNLRDRFEAGVCERVPSARVNGRVADRIFNTSNVSFEGLQSEAILILLGEQGICASAGSACSSGSLEPSHVLKAMRIEERFAHGAIRFSFSRFNSPDEIEKAITVLPELIVRLARLMPQPA